jgi:hypothetical protein
MRGLHPFSLDSPAANAVRCRESCRSNSGSRTGKMIFGRFDDRLYAVHNVMRQSIPGKISGTGTGS